MQHLLWGLSKRRCLFCMIYRRRGQTTTVIPGSRGGSGLLPLGAHEQAHLQPNHLKGTTEEGIVIKHHLLVLSNPWEHTRPAAVSAECSGQYPHARPLSLPRILQLEAACAAPPMWAK